MRFKIRRQTKQAGCCTFTAPGFGWSRILQPQPHGKIMSRPNRTTVTCKQCGAQQPFTAWESLNVTLNPKEKEELLKGTLTQFTCSKCNWSAEVTYPMLYHDMQKQLMIWLWPAGGEPDEHGTLFRAGMEDYKFRVVGARVDLVEKVFIFDAGLDDRVIEMMKLMARVQPSGGNSLREGPILFARVAEDEKGKRLSFEHLHGNTHQSFEVPYEVYEKVAAAIPAKPQIEPPANPWLRVGQEYALELMRRG